MMHVNIKGKLGDVLRKYAEQHCLNVSKFVNKLVKEKLIKEGIQIDGSVSKDSLSRESNS